MRRRNGEFGAFFIRCIPGSSWWDGIHWQNDIARIFDRSGDLILLFILQAKIRELIDEGNIIFGGFTIQFPGTLFEFSERCELFHVRQWRAGRRCLERDDQGGTGGIQRIDNG